MSVSKTLEFDGMCCPGCATNVESAVGNIDGVETAAADHGAKEVDVVFDDTTVSEDEIKQEM